MNFSSKVQKIIQDSEENYSEVVSGKGSLDSLKFNQKKTLKRINSYINSQYVERDDEALFWNISNYRITHFAKNIDLDTKDFLPYGEGEINFVQAWALRKKVKEWFRETGFYMTLNDISEGLATYGSMVWKKVKKDGVTTLTECNLDNLYFNQKVKNINDADGIVELHYLSSTELWEKEGVWDNVKEVLDIEKDKDNIEIWEFSGYHSEDGAKPTYKHTIGYGYGEKEVILWEEDKEETLYYDFHIGRYRGRWLRTGVVERLFKLQERANQLVNQNAQATEIASLLLFKTSNTDVVGNVLEQAINGQIISDPEFQQIGIDNRGLQQFISELQQIEAQADKLCLTPDIIQGEQAPSNTTFRTVAVINSAAKSAFTVYKQNLGEKIAEILLSDIFPTTVSKWNRDSMIEIAEDDQDIAVYDEAVKRFMAKEAMLSGQLVTPELVQEIDNIVAEGIKTTGRRINIGEKFFDFKWGFKMMATNESVDKQAMNDAYFNALQIQNANSASTDTPLFRQYLENNGISYWKLTPKQREQLQQAQSGAMPEQKKPDALLAQANPSQTS